MDRSTAEKLMVMYHRVSEALNQAEPVLRAIPEEQERKRHLRALGTMMADVWTELMAPIVREHPELDPDKRPGP
jgi:hypothetical protein